MLAVVADQLNQLLDLQEETIQTILTEQAVDPFGGGIGGSGNVPGSPGTFGTGAGGGGGGPGPHYSGSGGSGVVVIRYQIAEITGTAKATGGVVSFYNDGSGMKTIHTFTSTQTFAVNQEITNAEFVIVAGGGAGGKEHGGGGGVVVLYIILVLPSLVHILYRTSWWRWCF